jgi:hypothetical protein
MANETIRVNNEQEINVVYVTGSYILHLTLIF